jgi:plasmid stabilization system protein ParE
MAEVRRTPQAEADLEEILEHLHRTNPAAAERYATAFYDKGRALAQFPRDRPAPAGPRPGPPQHARQTLRDLLPPR